LGVSKIMYQEGIYKQMQTLASFIPAYSNSFINILNTLYPSKKPGQDNIKHIYTHFLNFMYADLFELDEAGFRQFLTDVEAFKKDKEFATNKLVRSLDASTEGMSFGEYLNSQQGQEITNA